MAKQTKTSFSKTRKEENSKRHSKIPRKKSIKAIIKEEIHKSHDSFFGLTFNEKQTIVDLLNHFIPREICDYIDQNSLNLDTTSYISKSLRSLYSDVVWRAKLNDIPIAIALLFEHKSSPPQYIHIQLDAYIQSILKKDIRAKQPLTFVLPIVIYHDTETWHYRPFSYNFKNLPSIFHCFIPQFDYILINLSYIPDSVIFELGSESILRCAFLAFKHCQDKSYVEQNFPAFFTFFENNPHLQDILEGMIVYLAQNAELREENISTVITNVNSSKIQSKVMTLYEHLILKGHKKGIEQGLEQGVEQGVEQGNLLGQHKKAVDVVKKGWRKGISIETLIELSDLSEAEVLRIIAEVEKEKS